MMNEIRTEKPRGRLAVIGASYLQAPLIRRAREMGLETHVFAWAAGDVGETLADHFYPISIVEKDEILEACRRIGIDGICTIASDLAAVTVGYVADRLGLPGNPPECIRRSTNKHLMRRAFEENGDPSPASIMVASAEELRGRELTWPVIVKPLDRSGSRGITKLEGSEGLAEAIENAKAQGFEKKALVEEYAEGREYSVECLSWQGKHRMLAVTRKYTTGAPRFIETGHMEPAGLPEETLARVRRIVFHALDSLMVRCGASHSELKIAPDGRIRLIEIGARMGGDLIGSDLVPLSTGVDFVGEVIRCALGQEPAVFRAEQEKLEREGRHFLFRSKTGGSMSEESWASIRSSTEIPGEAGGSGTEVPLTAGTDGISGTRPGAPRCAAVRFVFGQPDLEALERLRREHSEFLIREEVQPLTGAEVMDSSTRFGCFLMAAPAEADLAPYMPA